MAHTPGHDPAGRDPRATTTEPAVTSFETAVAGRTSLSAEEAALRETIAGLEAPQVDPREQLEIAQEAFFFSLENFPLLAEQALQLTSQAVDIFDPFLETRFEEDIEAVLPDAAQTIIDPIAGLLADTVALAESQLAGELSPEVQARIEREVAEKNLQTGLFGPASTADQVAALGLTTQQLQQQGVETSVRAAQLAASTLSLATGLTPPVTDPIQIGLTLLSQMTGIQINPNVAMNNAAQIGQTNASLAWQAEVSQTNALLDLYSTNLSAQVAADTASANQSAAFFSGIATVGATKLIVGCVPEGQMVDTPDGPVMIQHIKAGDVVIGFDGMSVKILQKVHYAEPADGAADVLLELENGVEVTVGGPHMVDGTPANEISVGDSVFGMAVVRVDDDLPKSELTYDLITESEGGNGGYRMSGIPVNSMVRSFWSTVEALEN